MAPENKRFEVKPVEEETPKPEPLVRLGVDTPPPSELRIAPPPRGGSGQRVLTTQEDTVPAESGLSPHTGEEVWGTGKKAVKAPPWGWIALLALISAGALVWALLTAGKGDRLAFDTRTEATPAMKFDRHEEEQAARLIDGIEETARRFLAAGTIAELQDLVRDPDRVLPLMERHYQATPPAPAVMSGIHVLQPAPLNFRGNFWIASVEVEGGSPRNLLLEVTGSDEVRVDWETAVTYQPMEWDRYANDRPEGRSMDFRVYVDRDSFHSHEFGDSAKWHSYRLTAPGSDETLFGYAAAGSAVARELAAIFRSQPRKQEALILRLLVPEGLNSPRGVVIEAIPSRRWTYVESP